jgi:hypothetical protein
MISIKRPLIIISCVLLTTIVKAQNPLITNQFTADPSARVFNGRVYVYPSHDIKATPGHGRAGWFVMEDYHVFSSDNLTNWTDHGMIVSQTQVPWADPASYMVNTIFIFQPLLNLMLRVGGGISLSEWL